MHPWEAPAGRTLSSTEIKALIELLLDDDPRTRSAVAERLADLGPEGASALEEAQESENARLRVRARRVLWELRTDAVYRELEEHVRSGEPDLETSTIMLARAENPGLEVASLTAEIDRLGALVGHYLADCGSLRERGEALGTCLCHREGFSGNVEHYEDPRNSYLDQVLQRRVGIPISLSAVYMLAGRRSGLELEGVGMPLHFLVAVREGDERLLLDPYGGGRIMSRESCKALLSGFHHSFREDYLRPVSDRHMLRRMIANLVRIYHNRHDNLRLRRLYRLVNVLQEHGS